MVSISCSTIDWYGNEWTFKIELRSKIDWTNMTEEENKNTDLKEIENRTTYDFPDDEYIGPTQVESYCVNCGDNGTTS
jgi:hypothetical protein